MRILVAGATGALGRQLLPKLRTAGHDVVAMIRSAEKLNLVRGLGAEPVIADALDPEAVSRAVMGTEPEVVVHQLTALAGAFSDTNMARAMEPTNRLRTEGTDHLLAAGRRAGVRRFVAQSFVGSGMLFSPTGSRLKVEHDPLDDAPPPAIRSVIAALRHLENAVTGAEWTEGVVLRYGSFYGPGTSFSPGGEHAETIRRRRLPLIGKGEGVWSFVHIEDAADATLVAIERGRPGIYHIVDDDPAQVSAWLPAAAAAMGAKPPLRVPRWLARLLAGEVVTRMMTEARGVSNTKARRDLDWAPKHPSWRAGFIEALR
jgi:nucleoside-diphosphate-sugar epimerase